MGATKEGWRIEEGEAVIERVTYRFLCARFLRGCRSGPREVQAHSMQKPQGTAWTGLVEPVALLSLRSVLWYAWPLIQPPGWSMAGLVDLDQRLGGCLIMGRGASYCAGDVSRNEGPPLEA